MYSPFHTLRSIIPRATQIIEMPWQQVLSLCAKIADHLIVDGCLAIHLYIGIFETSHTCHRTKVVIECSILLHEEDDMVDVGKGASTDEAWQNQSQKLRSLRPDHDGHRVDCRHEHQSIDHCRQKRSSS